jgi:hypothetical protein
MPFRWVSPTRYPDTSCAPRFVAIGELMFTPVEASRRIAVAGAGPAGLGYAVTRRAATEQGHPRWRFRRDRPGDSAGGRSGDGGKSGHRFRDRRGERRALARLTKQPGKIGIRGEDIEPINQDETAQLRRDRQIAE